MKPFSDKDLQRLNDAYKDVKSFSGQAAATAMRRVQAMSGEAVLQIAWANIRWLSMIATKEACRRWENTDKSWKLAGLMVKGGSDEC